MIDLDIKKIEDKLIELSKTKTELASYLKITNEELNTIFKTKKAIPVIAIKTACFIGLEFNDIVIIKNKFIKRIIKSIRITWIKLKRSYYNV